MSVSGPAKTSFAPKAAYSTVVPPHPVVSVRPVGLVGALFPSVPGFSLCMPFSDIQLLTMRVASLKLKAPSMDDEKLLAEIALIEDRLRVIKEEVPTYDFITLSMDQMIKHQCVTGIEADLLTLKERISWAESFTDDVTVRVHSVWTESLKREGL